MSTHRNRRGPGSKPPNVNPGSCPRALGDALFVPLVLALLAGCNRPPPPNAEITPLDPAALARADAASRAPPPPAPLPRTHMVLRATVPSVDLPALARALERRARGLSATEAHATVLDDGTISLDATLPLRAMVTLFRDQVPRRGLLSISTFDPACDPFEGLPLPPDMLRVHTRVQWLARPVFALYARPVHNVGVAPIGPIQTFVGTVPPPPGHALLIGAVRDDAGDVGRRTFCVLSRGALFAPHVIETESTLDASNLYPLLRIRLGPPDDTRLQQLRVISPGGLALAIDDEAIGLTDGRSPRGADWVQVQPEAPIPSVSPELVSALLSGGALPAPVEVVLAH